MQNYTPEMEKAAATVVRNVLHGIGKYLPFFGRKASPAVKNVPYARQMGLRRSNMLLPDEWRIHRIEQRLGRKLYPREMASSSARIVAPYPNYQPILLKNRRLDNIINSPIIRNKVNRIFKRDHNIDNALYPVGRPHTNIFAKRLP